MNRLIPDILAPPPPPPCQVQADLRRMQQEAAVRSDWDRARPEMKNAGVNEAELATRWRQTAGHSALDLNPQSRPASAGGG
jgi:hypothetical protein